jgi:hypothetical protein
MFGTISIGWSGCHIVVSRSAKASLMVTIRSAAAAHLASVRAIRRRTRDGIALTAFDSVTISTLS